MKSKFFLKILPLLFLTIGFGNTINASEINGNLSSAGVNDSNSNGSLSGTVVNTGSTGGGGSSGGGSSGGGSGSFGGGGFVIPNLQTQTANSGVQVFDTSISSANNLALHVPTVRSNPSPRLSFANISLAVADLDNDLSLEATSTETLAQIDPSEPIILENVTTSVNSWYDTLMNSTWLWWLLLILFLLIVLKYLYDKFQ
jgi:hypothetical protein